MKYLLVQVSLIFTLVNGCQKSEQESNASQDHEDPKVKLTVHGRDVLNEIAGSVYAKRATLYNVTIDSDTSEFAPIFIESKDGGINIDMNISYTSHELSHEDRLTQLTEILKIAAQDDNLDSLTGISMGRLILSGDLALNISDEYSRTFDDTIQITTNDYPEIEHFLQKSELADVLNKQIKPYGLMVHSVSIEKAFLTTSSNFVEMGINTLRNEKDYPTKILDCITYVRLKSINWPM